MSTDTSTTKATQRTRNQSPFVPLTGANSSWQLPVSVTGSPAGVFGFESGTSYHDATLMVIKPVPTVGIDARVAAKQARPPRGVPR